MSQLYPAPIATGAFALTMQADLRRSFLIIVGGALVCTAGGQYRAELLPDAQSRDVTQDARIPLAQQLLADVVYGIARADTSELEGTLNRADLGAFGHRADSGNRV